MSLTRAGERSAGVGATIQASPAFQTCPSETATGGGGGSAEQFAMDRDPVDLKDNLIHKLLASVRSARRLIDDHDTEFGDQIKRMLEMIPIS